MKKILSIILAAVMLIGISPIFGLDFAVQATDIGSCKVGDLISFGSYPQSKVSSMALATDIKNEGEKYEWIDFGYYAGAYAANDGTDAWADGEMKPLENMMQYKDIPYGGEIYRAVKINQYRPYRTENTPSSSNTEQDDNGYTEGNVYYFKFEPLIWIVLDPEEGYVMSNKVIDSQAYQNVVYKSGEEFYNSKACEKYASDWETSSLRQWLNADFYNTAFAEEEKAMIGTSILENKDIGSSKYDGNKTSDKIFIISFDDASNGAYGFNTDKDAEDTARLMKGTDYAKCQDLTVRTVANKSSYWLLRTSNGSKYVTQADYEGCLSEETDINDTGEGVVPAFRFNPKAPSTEPSENKLAVSISDISVFYKRTAKLSPKIEAEGENYTVAYSTSDSSVASVDANGNVNALKRGSAVITCTVTDSNGNSVSDTCTVTVSFAWWQWIIYIVLLGFLWY